MIELLLEAERALSVGMLDQAERLYRQASESDARNAIAIVGLARVALERGDEAGAIALGEQALRIDPENVAARRLVDRLIEVRAHRGEEPPVPENAPPVPEPVPPEPVAPPAPDEPAAAEPTPPRRGLLRRLLGRR